MKKKVLCVTLALLMCFLGIMPTFADAEKEALPERAQVTASYGLNHVSGSTYKMWAKIKNPEMVSISATLTLYNASYSQIASVGTTSSNLVITLSKNVTLSSGTYYLRLSYTVGGTTYTSEKSYTI